MTPCIEHTQKGSWQGYGKTWYKGASRRAHVVALMKATGEEQRGRWALHTCDNPRCVNPEHLYWGTPKQNSADRKARGHNVPGSPRKMTDEQVRRIRRKEASLSTLAREFGVTKQAVWLAQRRITYENVKD